MSYSTTDFELAEARFDLRSWCTKTGFDPQGRREVEWVIDCPHCGATDKLSVNVDTRRWRCFVCRKRMNLIELVASFEGSAARAVEVIAQGGGLRAAGIQFIGDPPAVRNTSTRAPDWAPLPIDPPPCLADATAHPYVVRRGYDVESMRLGGVSICAIGRYQDRLVFPVRRYPDGAWLYFQTRATWDKADQTSGRKYLKNLNPSTPTPETHATSSDVLLGLDLVVAYRLDWAMIVEGPTDWLGVGVGGVATFGKNLTDTQISLLVRAGVKRVFLAYDPDAWIPDRPGALSPALKAARRLSAVFDLSIVSYAPGTDPGNYTPAQNAAARAAASPFAQASRLARI